MHIIRSDTLGETFWREKSRQQFRQKVSPKVSDRIICMTPGETLSETRFFYAGPYSKPLQKRFFRWTTETAFKNFLKI